jgi:hypothetical protein
MYGLEGQEKKKKPEVFVFELEKEILDPKKNQEIKTRIEERIQKIKNTMRSGDDQQEYDRFGLLLQGYNSILKVMSRVKAKK